MPEPIPVEKREAILALSNHVQSECRSRGMTVEEAASALAVVAGWLIFAGHLSAKEEWAVGDGDLEGRVSHFEKEVRTCIVRQRRGDW
jgi:hypothetical protein